MKIPAGSATFFLGILCVPAWCQNAPADPAGKLNMNGKFLYYAKDTFSLDTAADSALTAAFVMAFPPDHYPRGWRDGAQGFGRNLGDAAVFTGSLMTAEFVAGAVMREDPRYFPSHSTHPAARVAHALAFTFIDRSDSGARRLALSNFAGAAASGFVGKAYLPRGFDDNAHAYQLCFVAFGVLGFNNLYAEFQPELRRFGHRLHLVPNP